MKHINEIPLSQEPFANRHARDRAGLIAIAVLSVVRDALDDPEVRMRVANVLRFEFADLVRDVFEDRPAKGTENATR